MITKAKKRPMISPPTPTLSSKAKRDCLQGTTPITTFFKTITPKKEDKNRMCESVSSDDEDNASLPSSRVSWVSELFESTLTSQTCCLECEEKSSTEETFLDISVTVTVTAEQVDVLPGGTQVYMCPCITQLVYIAICLQRNAVWQRQVLVRLLSSFNRGEKNALQSAT